MAVAPAVIARSKIHPGNDEELEPMSVPRDGMHSPRSLQRSATEVFNARDIDGDDMLSKAEVREVLPAMAVQAEPAKARSWQASTHALTRPTRDACT